jgi:hypothetical protein
MVSPVCGSFKILFLLWALCCCLYSSGFSLQVFEGLWVSGLQSLYISVPVSAELLSPRLHLLASTTMSDAPRKSRFDQTEPRRPTRFDRRSRSPPSRKTVERERSPVASPFSSPPAIQDKVAAAAARINAQIEARKSEGQHFHTPVWCSAGLALLTLKGRPRRQEAHQCGVHDL